MAVSEQFAGLDMEKLIGGPLTAAADASLMLANSTADFINKVGFDDSGKVRTVAFSYQKRSVNEDGSSNLDEMKVDVPMLAIVPIPNLQVDEVNVLFDMEVKQSESSKEATDLGAGFSGSANLGLFKVSISGSVSSHKENTRSSDNSAKYHVDVRATNHGTPEGLARVLDMMAANVAPALVGSTIKSADGGELPEASRLRAEKLKRLRGDISSIEMRRSAAWNHFQNCLAQLRDVAVTQQNVYSADMTKLMNTPGDDADSESIAKAYEQVAASWSGLQNKAENVIRMIVDSGEEGNDVSSLFMLMAFKNKEAQKYEAGEAQYQALATAQGNAVAAQKQIISIDQELAEKKAEYNNVLAGTETDTSNVPPKENESVNDRAVQDETENSASIGTGAEDE